MDGSVLEEKSSFKMLGLTFSSKLDWGSYIISIAKTASKKIGALIHSIKFVFPEVALYLYNFTMRPCMEYCCHIWAGNPGCYSELLDKLQKRKCRTIDSSLAASLEPWLIIEMWPAQVFSVGVTSEMFFRRMFFRDRSTYFFSLRVYLLF